MPHKALGDDLRHEVACVVFPLAAIKPQRKRKSVGEILRDGKCEAIGDVIGNVTLSRRREQDKNDWAPTSRADSRAKLRPLLAKVRPRYPSSK
jgi:hypothetical protein